MTVFGNPGEHVTCDRGHIICTVAEPLRVMSPIVPSLFKDWQQPQQNNAPIEPCRHCGAPWLRQVRPGGYQIRLASGWRG